MQDGKYFLTVKYREDGLRHRGRAIIELKREIIISCEILSPGIGCDCDSFWAGICFSGENRLCAMPSAFRVRTLQELRKCNPDKELRNLHYQGTNISTTFEISLVAYDKTNACSRCF